MYCIEINHTTFPSHFKLKTSWIYCNMNTKICSSHFPECQRKRKLVSYSAALFSLFFDIYIYLSSYCFHSLILVSPPLPSSQVASVQWDSQLPWRPGPSGGACEALLLPRGGHSMLDHVRCRLPSPPLIHTHTHTQPNPSTHANKHTHMHTHAHTRTRTHARTLKDCTVKIIYWITC